MRDFEVKSKTYVCTCGYVLNQAADNEWVPVCPQCGSFLHLIDSMPMEQLERFDAEADSEAALNEPYPNEHAARLKDPRQYTRFARTNNKFGDGIHAIWGIKNGKSTLQAIRFTASKWTVAEAKKWLKDHGYKPIKFEPATGGKESMEQVTEKAVAVHRSSKAPEDHPWDASAAQKRVVDKLGEKAWLGSCAWNDPDVDGVSAGKLPHHDIVDGSLKVVWNGVKAAGNAVQGARGGVKIPDSDIGGVKKHLAAHYDQFDKEPPWKESRDATDRAAMLTQAQLELAEMLALQLLERDGRTIDRSKLLVEVFQPDAEHFKWEDVMSEQGESQGLLRILAMVQRSDEPNKNRRIYPSYIEQRETEKLNKKAEARKSGTLLDHPPMSLFMMVGERLWDMCGRMTRTWREEEKKETWAEFLIEYQLNAKGRQLYSLIKTGFIPGLSSRGTGSTRSEERDGTTFDVICDDYVRDGYDFVSNESVSGAEIKSVQKESTTKQREEEEEEMDPKELKEAVEAAVSPLTERLGAIETKMVPKDKYEGEITAKNSEIETLKKESAEKVEALNVEIETLKKRITETTPPETLSEEALKGKVGEDLAYREHVLKALLVGAVTEANLKEKLEAASSLVTELLKREPKDVVHGDKGERKVEPPEKVDELPGKAIFEARGKKK